MVVMVVDGLVVDSRMGLDTRKQRRDLCVGYLRL